MTYELAKQLKDAGFPFKIATAGGEYFEDGQPQYKYLRPTLEELIEACGERFSELHSYSDGTWQAKSRGSSTSEEGWHDVMDKTPTEAVAKLWLALSTNKDVK